MNNKFKDLFSKAALSTLLLASASALQTSHASVLLSGWDTSPSATSVYGQIAMPKNDDSSSRYFSFNEFTELNFDSGVNFFGNTYNGFYVNNNGNITFQSSLSSFTPNPFPQTNQPMIAPYWADVDTRCSACGNVYLGASDANTMVFTWDSVGVYSNNASTTNTFQLVLIDRADEGAGNFDVQFRYEDINWTTGSASGGVPAQAGYDAGDGTNFFTLPGSRTSAVANLDEIFSNTSTPGIWSFEIREGALPGASPSNPIMPVIDPSNPTNFHFEFEVIDPNTRIFIDPDVAIGYDYIVNSGPNFASVLLPTGFDDNLFDLWLWDSLVGDWFDASIEITGGIAYNFANAVDRFRILGIDISNMVDPTLPDAFIAGLTFDSTGSLNMDQIAITQFVNTGPGPDPVNAPGTLLILLTSGLLIFARKRKLH